MSDTVIKVEDLKKVYLIGHNVVRNQETLRDAIVRSVRNFARTAMSMARGRQILGGDEIEAFSALDGVSFEIARGEVVGVIGHNGAGKSTLLKVLSRITEPTQGRVTINGRVASLLEVGTGFHPELTGRENIFLNGAILGMSRAEIRAKFDEIVEFAGIDRFIDTPVKRYSSGMYVRLAFSVAAHLEPEILIVDEVLAVGDEEFQRKCLGKMQSVAGEGRTVLFVSHNLQAVKKLCSRVIWLKAGSVHAAGETGAVIAAYLDEIATAMQDQEPAQQDYLYRKSAGEIPPAEQVAVTSLQMLDGAGDAVRTVGTWDPVTFRTEFLVRSPFPNFSVELCVTTYDGTPLILTSTAPDNTVHFEVEPGLYSIDCTFDALPLAAGDYLMSLRLAVPGIKYVWRNDTLCRFEVAPKDVFNSGLAPRGERYLVAAPHSWRAPARLE